MNKRWVVKDTDEQAASRLHESLRIDKTLCKLLVQRGITTAEEANKFFRPSLRDHLYDPFIMKDMDKAVERIDRAMRNGTSKILVYGDYDVDGTTAVALVYSFFKDFYFHVDYYIPNRYSEGYGISYQAIDYAAENGFGLIIALDCGIKAIEKIDYAKEKGIDFIICDHHRPGPKLPNAYAVLDPKRLDCEYPFKELSGCGVGFKLIQAFALHKDIPFRKVEKHLDLVAVSIAADIVPIVDENRVLAYYGLKRLNRRPRPGLRSLIELNSTRRRWLSIQDIVYVIAPRINAAGRMDDAKLAVKLLTSTEGMLAKLNAEVLQTQNTRRQRVDTTTTQEAMLILEDNEELANRSATVLYKSHWHKGVIGIVASRLIEKHFRPTIVMAAANDDGGENLVAGSARSVPGFDIYNAIASCSDLLEQFGGHKYAAGLTIKEDNVEEFSQQFEAVVANTIQDSMLVPEINIDAEIPLTSINSRFFKTLQQFEPFGPGNEKPIFVARELTDSGWSAVVGNNHLKLFARQDGSYNTARGIGYNLGDKYNQVVAQSQFDCCFTLELNRYNGSSYLQMNLKDVRVSGLIDEHVYAAPNEAKSPGHIESKEANKDVEVELNSAVADAASQNKQLPANTIAQRQRESIHKRLSTGQMA